MSNSEPSVTQPPSSRIPSIQIIFNKCVINPPSPSTPRRPKSAFFQKRKPPSFFPLNSTKPSKPSPTCSRSISPIHSRPNSSNNIQKFRSEIQKLFFRTNIQDTHSSFMTEQNAYILRYDSINAEFKLPAHYSSLTPTKPAEFCDEVKGFVHKSFPKRKTVTKKKVKRKVLNGEEPKTQYVNVERIVRDTSKVFRYTLKKTYHPVKYKLNYVPIRDKSAFLRREKVERIINY